MARRRVPQTNTAPVDLPKPAQAQIAPYPQGDAFPVVIGSNITIQSISTTLRNCTSGYRQPFVDLLNELLERDPHAFAVLCQRILTVAGGRLEVRPPKNVPRNRRKRAKQLADWVQVQIEQIRDLPAALASLAWGVFYGLSGLETQWGPTNDGYIRPVYLHFLHSRRLTYPAPGEWDLHIVDTGWNVRNANNPAFSGIRIDDYPGKFIIYKAQVRADYPTREGLGRQIAFYMALKGMAARGASTYVERYTQPPVLAKYQTGEDGKPRVAIKEDIEVGEAVAQGVAAGTLKGATIPNSVELELLVPRGNAATPGLTHLEFLRYCDAQISLAVLLNSEISDGGAESGSRAKAEVLEKLLRAVFRYDARQLAQTIKRDLVYWMVYYNFPEDLDICPDVEILIDDEPAPGLMMDLAEKAALVGMPMDLDKLAAMTGLPIVPPKVGDDPRASVLTAPVLADDARVRAVMKTILEESAIKEADDLKQQEAGKPGPHPGKKQNPEHINGGLEIRTVR